VWLCVCVIVCVCVYGSVRVWLSVSACVGKHIYTTLSFPPASYLEIVDQKRGEHRFHDSWLPGGGPL